MPVLRNQLVLNIAKGLKWFVNLEAGVTRGEVPDPGFLQARVSKLEQAKKRLEAQLNRRKRREAPKRRPSVRQGG